MHTEQDLFGSVYFVGKLEGEQPYFFHLEALAV